MVYLYSEVMILLYYTSYYFRIIFTKTVTDLCNKKLTLYLLYFCFVLRAYFQLHLF